jgi:hypothetical protein
MDAPFPVPPAPRLRELTLLERILLVEEACREKRVDDAHRLIVDIRERLTANQVIRPFGGFVG